MAAKYNPTPGADPAVREEMARRALRQSMTNLGYPGAAPAAPTGSFRMPSRRTRPGESPFGVRPGGLDPMFGRMPAGAPAMKPGAAMPPIANLPARGVAPMPLLPNMQIQPVGRPMPLPMPGMVQTMDLRPGMAQPAAGVMQRPFTDEQLVRARALSDYLRSLGYGS
jgi:hypothetical protein